MRYEVRQPADLGAAVAEFRALRGMTQAQLAEAVDVNRTYLSNLERGDVPAYVERLLQLVSALGLTLTIADQ
jgi:transcriptional regulator with XRE-family HTH domain